MVKKCQSKQDILKNKWEKNIYNNIDNTLQFIKIY